MNFYTEESGYIQLQPATATQLPGPVLTGAENFEFNSRALRIVVQVHEDDQFRIVHYVIRSANGKKILIEQKPFALLFRFGWKGSFNLFRKNKRNQKISEFQAAAFHSGEYCSTIKVRPNKEIRFLDTAFTDAVLAEMRSVFPDLESQLRRINEKIYNKILILNSRIREILHQLMNCPYSENMRRYFFEIKVRELLFEMLREQYKENPKTQLTPQELSAVYDAKRIITSDITRHHSISEIAKRVLLNEQKLKHGFREIFGQGIFELLKEHRLEEAKSLLRNTDQPLKQIASACGYARITGFITAFRLYFGITPSEYRRQLK